VAIGTFSTLAFLLALLFGTTDPTELVSSTAGPFIAVFYQITKNEAASIFLACLPLITIVFSGQGEQLPLCIGIAERVGCLTTTSRMNWALACDDLLPFSTHIRRVSTRFGTPLVAIIFSWVLSFIIGLLYLASTSAFNAIISSSVVALTASYSIPSTSPKSVRG
jgi:choline transport protein